MAKICHDNALTKSPDIVSLIHLSMECLWHYIINSQARGEPSAEEKGEENRQQPQKKQEGGVERQDVNYHAVTASSSRVATAATATNNAAMGEQHTKESMARTPPTPLFNIYEYFQPVFNEVDNLNKMLDSGIEEENDRWKEKKK